MDREKGSAAAQITQEELLKQMNESPGAARGLERADLAISYATPPDTLRAALEKAEIAVTGTVTTAEFRLRSDGLVYTFVTLVVESAEKGPTKPGESVTFMQSGGPVVHPSGHGGVEPQLLESKADPILLPGDRVSVLLVEVEYATPATLVPAWPFTSQYRLENGVVVPVAGNPFARDIEGLQEDEFADRLAQAAR
jgi:hypothetical protein